MVAIRSFLIGAFASVALAGEGVHLLDCGAWNSDYHYSVVVYCPDDGDCDRNPDPNNYCTMWTDWPHYPWPNNGQPASCKFPSGVTFNWSMDANAGNLPLFSPVGDGWNDGRSFKVYKDNGRIMYYDSYGAPCKSVYYAI